MEYARMTPTAELQKLLAEAEAIHRALTAIGVRSGAIGAANKLVHKIQAAIAEAERTPEFFTEVDRLAANAWRIARAAAPDTPRPRQQPQPLPTTNDFKALPATEQERWRQAAIAFREGDMTT